MEKTINGNFYLRIFILVFVVFSLQKSSFAQKVDFDYLQEISGFWQDVSKAVMEIRLDKEDKYVKVKKDKFIVKPIEIDSANFIIKLIVLGYIYPDGEIHVIKESDGVFFYYRMVFDKGEQTYHLVWMQETNGEQSPHDVDLYFKHK